MSSSTPRGGAKHWGPLLLTVTGGILGTLGAAWWYTMVRPAGVREQEALKAISRAEDLLKTGRPDQALVAVASVPKDEAGTAGVLTVKGMALAAMDQPEDARPLLEQTLKLNPDQPMAAKVLAAIYFNAHELDRGFQMLDRAARLDPKDFRPWFATGEMIMRFRNRPADAVKAFEQALTRRPDHVESQIGLISALLADGATAKATPILETALRDHPDDPRLLVVAARAAHGLGQREEMERFAERTLALEPNNVEALLLRARFLQQTGQPHEALGLAERAVALAPDDLTCLNLLALIEGSLGLKERSIATSSRQSKVREHAEQIEQLTEAMQKRPNDPEPRWRLGQAAAQGGMTALARSSFRAALALDPSCQPAREGLLAIDSPRGGTSPAPFSR